MIIKTKEMKSTKYRVLLAFVAVIITACGPSKQELANALLDEAQAAMESTNFNEAKLKVDSVNLLYPNQIEAVAAGLGMMQRIELYEQKQSLVYYDTLLVTRQADFNRLVKSFVFQEGKFEGYAGTYIHKRQQVKNSHDRTYVRAYLDDKGDFYISSRYHGKGHIHHHSIKVYDGGVFAETEKIAEATFDNRSFDDGEDYWETVNYRNGADNGVVGFIVNNYDKTLKVEFKGKKHYYIVMESFDKEAIRDAYNLSLVIKEMADLKANKLEAEKRVTQLQNALKTKS